MSSDGIAEVGIDARGRLYVTPESQAFPYIYREAMEVHWDAQCGYLHGPPPPRAELASPAWWFRQILAAAKAQGCQLQLGPQTRWRNLSTDTRKQIELGLGGAAA